MDLEHINLSKYKDMAKPTKICKKCGKQAWFNEGIGKNGKPYKMIKCTDCGHVEWLQSLNPATDSSPEAIKAPTSAPNKVNGEMIILETLEAHIKKFDIFEEWLRSKFN